MMLLCIDVGNTNTLLGVANKNQILHCWRIRTEKETTSDELGLLISGLVQSVGLKHRDIDHTIISCVVPNLLNAYKDFSRRYLSIDPLIVGDGLDTGMPIRYHKPEEVGADRIVNAVAAYEKHRSALVVVDFGTATTFDYVSREGEYIGGAIAPGVLVSCEALFQRASKLPRVEIFTAPKSVIGRDTISSMNVGIVYGYGGLVDGIVNRLKNEAGEDLTVIATGGLASVICEVSETIHYVEEFLAIKGLMVIFKKNQEAFNH